MSNEPAAVQTLGVIGAGTMGHGIAQTAILAGITTVLRDVDRDALDAGLGAIEKGLARLVDRDRLSPADKEAALARLRGTIDYADLADVDAVIEAAPERLELKQAIFEELDQCCVRARFLASNTSSIPIQEIASRTARTDRVVGLHYFNPAQVLPLVEVVTPLTASPEAVDAAEAFCRATGKTPIRVKDTPGFVVNRLFVPFALDAMRLWESAGAAAEDIDSAIKLGLGHSMGPLATSDLVGLDVMLDVAEAMYHELREQRFAPPPVLRRLVTAGRLGRKTGRGIFDYAAD